MAPSFLALQALTASKWATDRERTALAVLKAPSVNGAPPSLHPALRKHLAKSLPLKGQLQE